MISSTGTSSLRWQVSIELACARVSALRELGFSAAPQLKGRDDLPIRVLAFERQASLATIRTKPEGALRQLYMERPPLMRAGVPTESPHLSTRAARFPLVPAATTIRKALRRAIGK